MGLFSAFKAPSPEPRLMGEKVVVRPPCMDDFPAWRAERLASQAFLVPWEPEWRDDDHLAANFRARLRRYDELMAGDMAFPFFIFSRESQAFLGAITVSHIRRGVADMATLGYWVGASHARKGYMTDAIRVVSQHAFTHLSLHRLEAACLPRNAASIKLLQRSGFEREGYARQYLKIAGRWEDHLLWSKLSG